MTSEYIECSSSYLIRFLVIAFFFVGSVSSAQNSYPELDKFVSDSSGIFSEKERKNLEVKLSDFESETTNQIVVLTIEGLKNETIETYAYKTFAQNNLGQKAKDNGILILVSKKDKQVCRNWCRERGVRMTVAPKGKRPEETVYEKRKRKKKFNERNAIEGKFGQAKQGYGLNNIKAKLSDTSHSWIGAILFVTNLVKFAELNNFQF